MRNLIEPISVNETFFLSSSNGTAKLNLLSIPNTLLTHIVCPGLGSAGWQIQVPWTSDSFLFPSHAGIKQ